jgi:hypothetical protein
MKLSPIRSCRTKHEIQVKFVMNELEQKGFPPEIQDMLVCQAGHLSYRLSDFLKVLLVCSRQRNLLVSENQT